MDTSKNSTWAKLADQLTVKDLLFGKHNPNPLGPTLWPHIYQALAIVTACQQVGYVGATLVRVEGPELAGADSDRLHFKLDPRTYEGRLVRAILEALTRGVEPPVSSAVLEFLADAYARDASRGGNPC